MAAVKAITTNTQWHRGLPGLWFALYTPAGIAMVLVSHYSPRINQAVWTVLILGAVNAALLWFCRRRTNGSERPKTRTVFIFGPAAFAAASMMIFKSDFDGLNSPVKLNYIFNMMYAAAAFGFWLPVNEVKTREEAKIYYEEYKN
jgi:hypothetical protein